jgi:hypothetical protein
MLAVCPVSWLADLCLRLSNARSLSLVKIFSTLLIHAQLLGTYRMEKVYGH